MVYQKFSLWVEERLVETFSIGKKKVSHQKKKSRGERNISRRKKMYHGEKKRICPTPQKKCLPQKANLSQQNKEKVKKNSD